MRFLKLSVVSEDVLRFSTTQASPDVSWGRDVVPIWRQEISCCYRPFGRIVSSK